MKQHSADGCAAPGGGASDTTWSTLRPRTRFGDDQNTVLRDAAGGAPGARPLRDGDASETLKPTLQRGTRFGDDQNTVLRDAAESARFRCK